MTIKTITPLEAKALFAQSVLTLYGEVTERKIERAKLRFGITEDPVVCVAEPPLGLDLNYLPTDVTPAPMTATILEFSTRVAVILKAADRIP